MIKLLFTEAGGQVGDSGNIYTHEKNLIGKIIDTKKLDGDIFLHYVKNNTKELKVNKKYMLSVDIERREKIRNNHSAYAPFTCFFKKCSWRSY